MDISKQKKFLKSNGEKLVAIGFLFFILQVSMVYAGANEVYSFPFGFLGGLVASFGALGQLIYYKNFFDKPNVFFKLLKLFSYFLYVFIFLAIGFLILNLLLSIYDLILVLVQ